jgi:hypothetical protein
VPHSGITIDEENLMNKLMAAVVASTFAFASMSTIAADTTKKDELTVEQRAEMRARADQMKMQRGNTPVQEPVKDKVERKAHKAKHSAVHFTHKTKKTAKREARKARGQA